MDTDANCYNHSELERRNSIPEDFWLNGDYYSVVSSDSGSYYSCEISSNIDNNAIPGQMDEESTNHGRIDNGIASDQGEGSSHRSVSDTTLRRNTASTTNFNSHYYYDSDSYMYADDEMELEPYEPMSATPSQSTSSIISYESDRTEYMQLPSVLPRANLKSTGGLRAKSKTVTCQATSVRPQDFHDEDVDSANNDKHLKERKPSKFKKLRSNICKRFRARSQIFTKSQGISMK